MRSFAALAVAVIVTSFITAADDKKKGTEVELAGMKSTTPADWKEEAPSNAMRLTQFKLPKAEGDKDEAELALFKFPGGSGTVEANLKRQVAKFQPADGKDKVEETIDKKFKVGEIAATYQDVKGTFIKKPFPMAEKGTPVAGYRQLYVVFETKDSQYYFTLIGPEKTVEKHKKGFDEWLKNFK